MINLRALIGREHELEYVSLALQHYVRDLCAATVGALEVNCSDEAEHEVMEAFQHAFVEPLLPDLKQWIKAAFRTSNLGGRYEWGAVRVAEQHFATPESRDEFKVILLKLNAHVCVTPTPDGPVYGQMERYHARSSACGALHGLLRGEHLPGIAELRATFAWEGHDRLGALLDPQSVAPAHRNLIAAAVNARLQARRAVLDLLDYRPQTPTVYLVVPCVTFNRPGRDTEFVCGYYVGDARGSAVSARYCGLGDDPAAYRLEGGDAPLRISDSPEMPMRPARDHRRLTSQTWQRRDAAAPRDLAAPPSADGDPVADEAAWRRELRGLLERGTLPLETLGVLLFATGLAGIHHALAADRLARGVGAAHEAQQIVAEVLSDADKLPIVPIQAALAALRRVAAT